MSEKWMVHFLCRRWFGRKNLKVRQTGETEFKALAFGYRVDPYPSMYPRWIQLTTKTHKTAEGAIAEAMAFKAHCDREDHWRRTEIMLG